MTAFLDYHHCYPEVGGATLEPDPEAGTVPAVPSALAVCRGFASPSRLFVKFDDEASGDPDEAVVHDEGIRHRTNSCRGHATHSLGGETMNKKLIKASVAGAAAIALAAGGSTFASWSDSGDILNNVETAGHLKLNLNGSGTISNVGGSSIAPGESYSHDYFLTSADLDGVPSAKLSMLFHGLTDAENLCGSSNSEAAVDTDCATNPAGEFSQQAYVRIRWSNPEAATNITWNAARGECTPGAGNSVASNSYGYTPANSNDQTTYPRLGALVTGGAFDIATLTKGQGVCMRVDVGLDKLATNAVQSDSSEFDVTYTLDQILS